MDDDVSDHGDGGWDYEERQGSDDEVSDDPNEGSENDGFELPLEIQGESPDVPDET